jgi:sensor histidine kinase regulating citrate/malate metabolism
MQKEKKPMPIRWQLIITNISIVLITITFGTVISLTYFINQMEHQLISELRTVAFMLSKTDIVIDTLIDNEPNETLNNYIDQIVAGSDEISIVTVADMTGKRIYHLDKDRIGEYFVGGDDIEIYNGKNYSSKAYGTLGNQLRYFYPVFDSNGNQVGFVMASTLVEHIDVMKQNIYMNMTRWSLIVLCISISIAVVLAERIKNSLIGYEPSQIAKILIQREEIFDALEEGLVAVNKKGEIIFANKSALTLIGISAVDILNKKAENVLPQTKIMDTMTTGEPANNLNTYLNNHDIIYSKIPIKDKAEVVGAILMMRNRTEVKQLAQQLTGVNHFIDSLKANNHEFMNKLHIILGLLEIGAVKDAENFITELSNRQSMIINTITGKIENRRIAALLIGKISRGNELNIRVKLLPNSYLPSHSKFLSTDALTTIIGNLIENSMEAINGEEKDDRESEEISILIQENENELVISVDDTGIGMSDEVISNVKKGRFSTKGQGRGFGMTLIKNIVESNDGEMTIDSKVDVGTNIVIVIRKKRFLA